MSRFILYLITAAIIFFSTSAHGAFPGQNGKIVFERAGGGISVINPNGTGEIVLTTGPDFMPQWSPDGTKIVFIKGYQTGRIGLINNDASNLIEIVVSGDVQWPSFSPDGSRIIYSKWGSGIWRVDANGQNETNLAYIPNCNHYEVPVWSPDGSKIAFDAYCDLSGSAQDESFTNVFLMNSDGSNLTQITSNTAVQGMFLFDWGPDWSPDGSKMLFNREVSTAEYTTNQYSLVTYELANSNTVTLIGPSNQIFMNASWAPDGTKITADGGGLFSGIFFISSKCHRPGLHHECGWDWCKRNNK